MRFLTEAGERALAGAIEEVEARSRAEIVVVIRPVVGGHLGADLLVANLAAFSLLGVLLYSAWDLAPYWLLVLPALTIAAVVGLVRVAPALRRVYLGDAAREAATRKAGAACFFERGILETRERVGVLVFVAVAERKIEIFADAGITGEVPQSAWREAAGLLEAVFHDGGGAVELAERITQALGPRLERWCEARPDDTDELPNAIGS